MKIYLYDKNKNPIIDIWGGNITLAGDPRETNSYDYKFDDTCVGCSVPTHIILHQKEDKWGNVYLYLNAEFKEAED